MSKSFLWQNYQGEWRPCISLALKICIDLLQNTRDIFSRVLEKQASCEDKKQFRGWSEIAIWIHMDEGKLHYKELETKPHVWNEELSPSLSWKISCSPWAVCLVLRTSPRCHHSPTNRDSAGRQLLENWRYTLKPTILPFYSASFFCHRIQQSARPTLGVLILSSGEWPVQNIGL